MKNPKDYNVFKDLKKTFRECGFPICGESHLEGNYLEVRCARHWRMEGYAEAIRVIYYLIQKKISIRIAFEPSDHRRSVSEEGLIAILNCLPNHLRVLLTISNVIGPRMELKKREMPVVDHRLDKREFKRNFQEALDDVQHSFPLIRKYWKEKYEIEPGK
jgi:hypothetical protein